jgi:cell wall-associated NlpC family hydrolase
MRNAPIHRGRRGWLVLAASLGALGGLTTDVAPAAAGSGGVTLSQSGGTSLSQAPVPGSEAKIVNGLAVPPKQAPRQVVDAIEAANKIAKGHPYCLGGGHAHFRSSCYDCSGSVSYALHGAGLLNYPQASSGFYGWGHRGRGSWITVYANGGHAFMTIAGLRFDTSDTPGQGPGWARGMGYENPRSYQKRHKPRF